MKKILVIGLILLLTTLSLNINISADNTVPETPESTVTLSSSQKTVRFGDDVSISLSGLSFKNSIGIKNLMFDLYTEYYDTTQKLQEIVIPRFDSVSDGDDHGVAVRIMAFVQGGSSYRIVKEFVFQPNDGQTSVTLTRDELTAWLDENNNGEMPKVFYFYFSNTINGELDYSMSRKFYELKQSAPIQFNYKVVDGLPYNNNVYQFFQGKLSWYTTSTNDRTTITKGVYPYFETSDIEVTSSKYDNLLPGDTVELTFKVSNNSNIRNNYLWLGFDAQGLELVSDETIQRTDLNLSATDWRVGIDQFYASMKDNGTWIRVDPNTEYTTTQLFKIQDDFDLGTIDINPFLFNGSIYERDVDPGITLYLSPGEEEGYIPEENPETPEEKPETPEEKPETPEEKPETPEVKPEAPEEKPVYPDVLPVLPEVPEVKPDTPETPIIPEDESEIVPEMPQLPGGVPEQPQETPIEDETIEDAKPDTTPEVLPDTGLSSKTLLSIGLVSVGSVFLVSAYYRKKQERN